MQDGVARANIYYSVLKRLLLPSATTLQISLGKYLSYDELLEKTTSVINKREPDTVCVFMRPFPLLPLHKPIVKYNKENGNVGWSPHPALVSRQLLWPTHLTRFQADEPFRAVKKAFISFADLNLFLGQSLLLHRWAMRYLEEIIRKLQETCLSKNAQLIIITPPKSPGSIAGGLMCKRVAQKLTSYCNKKGITVIDINSIPKQYFTPDLIHVNEKGHEFIAQQIYQVLNCEVAP